MHVFDQDPGLRIEDLSPAHPPALIIPEWFQAPRPGILVPPWESFRLDGIDWNDILINIAGFLPFGFFYFLHRRAVRPGHRLRNVWRVLWVSGALSLSIELVQVFLPSRSSSATDVLCNVLGALLGLGLAPIIAVVERRFSTDTRPAH